MEKHAANYDYADYYRAFAGQFLGHLQQRFPELSGQETALVEAADHLTRQQTHLIVDPASEANLRLGALALVAYRVLSQHPREDVLPALQAAFSEPFRAETLEGVRALLNSSDDPLQAIAEVSKEREEQFFGGAFLFERVQDDQFAYLVNVKRCLWHRFFTEQKTPELTPIFCAFDLNWMDAVNPAQHGLRVERPTTLGWGHDCCRFWHIRTQPQTPQVEETLQRK